MFKFYLNNTLVSDPLNWNDFTETLERDDTIKGLLPKYEIRLTFNAGGYTLLYNLKNSSGFCNLVPIRIEKNNKVLLNGYVFIKDCKFNLNKCTVECAVEDNNFGARIYNNKNIKAKLDISRSKNEIAITPSSIVTTGIFSVSNVFLFNRSLIHVKDAFRYLVEFMSDGEVGFESDIMTIPVFPATGNTISWLYIGTGQELRLGDGTIPIISFQQLFEEVNKKYPIAFTIIQGSDGRPTIKIELESYFYSSTSATTIANIDDLIESFNEEKLYSSIKLGGESIDYSGATAHFEQIRFFNFQNEEYFLQGECNIDKTLDLTANFISDSNIIEIITDTTPLDETYDDDIFFIESIYGLGTELTNNPLTSTNPYYYNSNLKNNKVAERYSVANNIALYLGNNDDLFLASSTIDLVAASGVFYTPFSNLQYNNNTLFQDDFTPPNFDTNNRYDITTSRYTSIANGSYTFNSLLKAELSFNSDGYSGMIVRPEMLIQIFDASNNEQTYLEPEFVASSSYTVNSGRTLLISDLFEVPSIYIPNGYYAIVQQWFTVDPIGTFNPGDYNEITITIQTGSTFECVQSVNGGGVYEEKVAEDYFVSKLEFDKPISDDQYDLIKADLSKSIIINHDGKSNKTTWIRKTSRKMSTGETKFELISNLNNS